MRPVYVREIDVDYWHVTHSAYWAEAIADKIPDEGTGFNRWLWAGVDI